MWHNVSLSIVLPSQLTLSCYILIKAIETAWLRNIPNCPTDSGKSSTSLVELWRNCKKKRKYFSGQVKCWRYAHSETGKKLHTPLCCSNYELEYIMAIIKDIHLKLCALVHTDDTYLCDVSKLGQDTKELILLSNISSGCTMSNRHFSILQMSRTSLPQPYWQIPQWPMAHDQYFEH